MGNCIFSLFLWVLFLERWSKYDRSLLTPEDQWIDSCLMGLSGTVAAVGKDRQLMSDINHTTIFLKSFHPNGCSTREFCRLSTKILLQANKQHIKIVKIVVKNYMYSPTKYKKLVWDKHLEASTHMIQVPYM